MFDFDEAREIYSDTLKLVEDAQSITDRLEKILKREGMRLSDFAEAFILARKCKEPMEEASKEFSKVCNNISYSILPEAMFQQDVSSVKTASGYRVTVMSRFNVTMTDKVKGYEWLKENNLGDIITPTVNAQTLSSTMRKMVEDEGIEPPEDIFKVFMAPYASITKAG